MATPQALITQIPVNSDDLQIKDILPHREHALCIDSAVYDPREPDKIKAFWRPNTHYFEGHFPPPNTSILPGHWILEFACLTGAILARLFLPNGKLEGLPVLTNVNNMRILRPVEPNSRITCYTTLEEADLEQRIAYVRFASVLKNEQGKLVAEVSFTGAAKKS